jgi:hypothetical protein
MKLRIRSWIGRFVLGIAIACVPLPVLAKPKFSPPLVPIDYRFTPNPSASSTKPTQKPILTAPPSPNPTLTPISTPAAAPPVPNSTPTPVSTSTPTPKTTPNPTPTPNNSSSVVPPPPPPPPPSPAPAPAPTETANNPLSEPQDISKILNTTMTTDQWVLMYQPLDCLDTSLECVQKLQQQSIDNSQLIRELNAKIQEVNTRIEEAKTNNQKSIDLSIFEPGLQVFLKQDIVVENGQSRKMGFTERLGQIFTNPGGLLNDLLGAIGIPLLRGSFGGSDAQQSRSIQISELTVKVAEMERGKVEIASRIRDKTQDLVLAFDVAAREFQAEQAIVKGEVKSFKIYSVTYAAGDGDTNTYLNRKEQLERSKLKVFKDWAKLRAQIVNLKNMVIPRDL